MQHSDLAWSLAEVAGHLLNDSQRCSVYVALGAGDYFEAITTVARVALDNRMALPPSIGAALIDWRNTYGADTEVAEGTALPAHPQTALSCLTRDHRPTVLNVAAPYRHRKKP